jgi:NAD-dependent DNA ligase
VLPVYEEWRLNEFPNGLVTQAVINPTATVINPTAAVVQAVTQATTQPTVSKGTLCFTGFRNKEFEALCVQKGYTVSDSITKKTNYLIIPDTEGYSSTKVDKAKASNISVVSFSDFQKTL